jgi:Mor family transcriptional regulator
MQTPEERAARLVRLQSAAGSYIPGLIYKQISKSGNLFAVGSKSLAFNEADEILQRHAAGERQSDLAREFRVSRSTVNRLVKRGMYGRTDRHDRYE